MKLYKFYSGNEIVYCKAYTILEAKALIKRDHPRAIFATIETVLP